MTRLTRPQKILLYSIIEGRFPYVSKNYRPAKKLVELEYAQWAGDGLKATPKGKRVYREEIKK